jgi:hypothetical protein
LAAFGYCGDDYCIPDD